MRGGRIRPRQSRVTECTISLDVAMPTQAIRRAKLHEALQELKREGHATREAQALYIGGSATARRLDAMLGGADIPVLFVTHVEHVLFKPKGWMSNLSDSEETSVV
jgi:hypothetical protein